MMIRFSQHPHPKIFQDFPGFPQILDLQVIPGHPGFPQEERAGPGRASRGRPQATWTKNGQFHGSPMGYFIIYGLYNGCIMVI